MSTNLCSLSCIFIVWCLCNLYYMCTSWRLIRRRGIFWIQKYTNGTGCCAQKKKICRHSLDFPFGHTPWPRSWKTCLLSFLHANKDTSCTKTQRHSLLSVAPFWAGWFHSCVLILSIKWNMDEINFAPACAACVDIWSMMIFSNRE